MSIEENKDIVRRYQEIYNSIVRIADGKIVEHWGEEDGVSLLQQAAGCS